MTDPADEFLELLTSPEAVLTGRRSSVKDQTKTPLDPQDIINDLLNHSISFEQDDSTMEQIHDTPKNSATIKAREHDDKIRLLQQQLENEKKKRTESEKLLNDKQAAEKIITENRTDKKPVTQNQKKQVTEKVRESSSSPASPIKRHNSTTVGKQTPSPKSSIHSQQSEEQQQQTKVIATQTKMNNNKKKTKPTASTLKQKSLSSLSVKQPDKAPSVDVAKTNKIINVDEKEKISSETATIIKKQSSSDTVTKTKVIVDDSIKQHPSPTSKNDNMESTETIVDNKCDIDYDVIKNDPRNFCTKPQLQISFTTSNSNSTGNSNNRSMANKKLNAEKFNIEISSAVTSDSSEKSTVMPVDSKFCKWMTDIDGMLGSITSTLERVDKQQETIISMIKEQQHYSKKAVTPNSDIEQDLSEKSVIDNVSIDTTSVNKKKRKLSDLKSSDRKNKTNNNSKQASEKSPKKRKKDVTTATVVEKSTTTVSSTKQRRKTESPKDCFGLTREQCRQIIGEDNAETDIKYNLTDDDESEQFLERVVHEFEEREKRYKALTGKDDFFNLLKDKVLSTYDVDESQPFFQEPPEDGYPHGPSAALIYILRERKISFIGAVSEKQKRNKDNNNKLEYICKIPEEKGYERVYVGKDKKEKLSLFCIQNSWYYKTKKDLENPPADSDNDDDNNDNNNPSMVDDHSDDDCSGGGGDGDENENDENENDDDDGGDDVMSQENQSGEQFDESINLTNQENEDVSMDDDEGDDDEAMNDSNPDDDDDDD